MRVEGGSVEAAAETRSLLYPALKQTSFQVFWEMPKWGSSYAECGKITHVVSCEEKHKPVLHGYHCYRPECPICYEYWANREAKRATERIEVAKELYGDAGKQIGKPKHVIFSPPQEWAINEMETVEGYKKVRSECNRIAKSAGFMGGCLIFHSHRKEHKDDHTNCERENCEREHVWEISPHFHTIGYGFLEKADRFWERTNWVYKNKGQRKTVFGTIKYLLTHCGLGYVGETRKFWATTWYGILGCNQVVIDTEKIVDEYPVCPECGGHLIKWFIAGDDEHWIPEGDYVRKTRVRTYRLRKLPYKQTAIMTDYG